MHDNFTVFWECGPGWNTLIRPLVDRCTKLGGTVDQVKEKFGRLRFYYTPGDYNECDFANDREWADFEDAVNQACTDSGHMCELCGNRGILMVKGRWYKTLCKEHSIELAYQEKA